MIVVSEDSEDPDRRPEIFLLKPVNDSVLNINHDYRYLRLGYYVSTHAEIHGQKVTPSTEEIMDAYRNPLLIGKANKHGIRTSYLNITTSMGNNTKSPLMLFSVSPFTNNSMTITNKDSNLENIIKRMSMNKRYPVSVHLLKGEVKEIIQIFGESSDPKYTEFTKKFYDVFNIPICKLIIQEDEDGIILNHCEPALKKDVNWNLVYEKVKYINIG